MSDKVKRFPKADEADREPTEREMREYERFCRAHPEYTMLLIHRTGRVLHTETFMDTDEMLSGDFGGPMRRAADAVRRFENRGKPKGGRG